MSMLGQYRKCKFCGRRFRLTGKRGIIRTAYNYVSLVPRHSYNIEYAHKTCYKHFLRTKPRDVISEFKAGYNTKNGIFLESSIREE